MRSSPLLIAALALVSTVAGASSGHRKHTHRAERAKASTLAREKRAVSTKKGLGYNTASFTAAFGNSIAWAYNWADTPNGELAAGVEFVPMMWGQKTTTGFNAATRVALTAGSKFVLGPNEPDEDTANGGSDMTVSAAAALYKQYVTPFKGSATLVSPAVTNGDAPMGTTYLTNFLAACGDCGVEAVALHWYDLATNVAYFKKYLTDAHTTFPGKDIWLTEFAGSGSVAEQQSFLEEVIPWMEAQEWIARYAYEGDFAGTFVNADGSLTALGVTYRDTV